MYKRLHETWEAQSQGIKDLIISNIKADIEHQLLSRVKMIETECKNLPEMEDQEPFEAELQQELNKSYDRLDIPDIDRPRREGELRDAFPEVADPLSPSLENTPGF